MKSASLIAIGVTVATVGWILSGQVSGTPEPVAASVATIDARPKVQVVASTATPTQRTLSLQARTEAVRIVHVRTETTAGVVDIDVQKGQRVQKGDVLVRLAIDDRRARLGKAEALRVQRALTFEAAERLARKAYRSEVKRAEAKADLETANAALAAVKLDLARTVVRAPFDGVIDDVSVEIGDLAQVGQAVVTLVDTSQVLVVASAPERVVIGLHVGDQASVELINGNTVTGPVRYVAKCANPLTRTFRIEVALDNADGRILQGMTAELKLPMGSVQAHSVSKTDIVLSDDGTFGVKTVEDDGSVAFHALTYIDATGDNVVVAGLPESIRIIQGGGTYTRQGQAVAVVGDTGGVRVATID